MTSRLARLNRPPLIIPEQGSTTWKNADTASRLAPPSGALTPDLQPSTPNGSNGEDAPEERLSQVEHYIIGPRLSECPNGFSAYDLQRREELKCKVFPVKTYRKDLAPYYRLGLHEGVIPVREVLLGERYAYVFFDKDFGDLHSYVRDKKKLPEEEAKRLFRQIADVVRHCHDSGVVINQLKLRKFVFKDKSRTQLMLDSSLEDARVLDISSGPATQADDTIREKHGCPAYVSPEILDVIGGGPRGYSGRAADVWSMGVVLYTLLLGRYPFQDLEPTRLFLKIRQGRCTVPSSLSPLARCLIKTMLRPEADQRLDSTEILRHPWFKAPASSAADLGMSPMTLAGSGVAAGSTVAGTTVLSRGASAGAGGPGSCLRQHSHHCCDQLVPDDKFCAPPASKAVKRKSEIVLANTPPTSMSAPGLGSRPTVSVEAS